MTEISAETQSLIPVEDQALLDATKEQFAQIIEASTNFVIASPENLEQATDMVKILKNGQKRLESRRVELKAPHLEAGSTIDTTFKKVIALANKGIGFLSDQQTQYHLKIEAQIQKEETERRERESERLEQDREELAEVLAVSCGEADIDAEIEALEERETNLNRPLPMPKSTSRGNIGSSSLRRDWTYEVKDITKVPAKYLLVDGAKVNTAIKKMKVRNIPGLRIFEQPTTVTR